MLQVEQLRAKLASAEEKVEGREATCRKYKASGWWGVVGGCLCWAPMLRATPS